MSAFDSAIARIRLNIAPLSGRTRLFTADEHEGHKSARLPVPLTSESSALMLQIAIKQWQECAYLTDAYPAAARAAMQKATQAAAPWRGRAPRMK